MRTTNDVRDALNHLETLPLGDAIAWAAAMDPEAAVPMPDERAALTARDLVLWELAAVTFEEYRRAQSHPGYRLDVALQRAKFANPAGIRERAVELDADAQLEMACPRWPFGISKLDERTNGGGYGVVSLSGVPGSAKSLVALIAALLAAACGWRVIYFDAELGTRNFRQRVARAVRGSPHLRRVVEPNLNDVRERIQPPIAWREVSGLARTEDLLDEVSAAVAPWDNRVLIVVDSINTVARMLLAAQGGRNFDYFRVLGRLGAVAMETRKATDGAISWLLVSELTRSGGVVGRELEYVCDLDIRFSKCDTDEFTEIRVAKGREGGEGNYGAHYRNWRLGRLEEAPAHAR